MQITPLPQGFGAEIDRFDLAGGGTADEIARLQQAFREHHLLVFRGEGVLGAERQVEVTGWFGPVISEGGVTWTVLDNAEPAGSYVLPFHSDITFCEHPLRGISLHPEAIPPGGTTTTFVSNAVAWRALPEALRQELAERTARHSYVSEGNIDLGFPAFEHWHPVRMLDPDTGEPLLFVTEHHVDRIEGLPDARCAEVLAQRVMRRVQLGETGFLAQLERLRREAAPAG
jgi:taurine dioxygenase